jgi:hypothetical protein
MSHANASPELRVAEPSEALFHPNGVGGAGGEYVRPAMAAAELSQAALGRLPYDLNELQSRSDSRKKLGVKDGVSVGHRAQAGWGVIFAHDADPESKQALKPALDHRQRQLTIPRTFQGGQ